MRALGIALIQLDCIILIQTGPLIAPVHIPERNRLTIPAIAITKLCAELTVLKHLHGPWHMDA